MMTFKIFLMLRPFLSPKDLGLGQVNTDTPRFVPFPPPSARRLFSVFFRRKARSTRARLGFS